MSTQITWIADDAELERVHAEIETLMDLDPAADSIEGRRLKALATLSEAYEAEHYTIKPLTPLEHIEFAMERHGLTRKDLEPVLGSSARVSEILNARRTLTLPMIRALSKLLHIPVDLLVAEYPVRAYGGRVYHVEVRPQSPDGWVIDKDGSRTFTAHISDVPPPVLKREGEFSHKKRRG